MKLLVNIVLAFSALLLLLVAVCFKPLNTTPYRKTAFYKNELKVIDGINGKTFTATDSSSLQVGWASINLLPPFTTPIAIDAHRGGKHFEGVHDSIYVRAIVFKQGTKKFAYVSADLLIIPPLVSKMFDSLLLHEGFDQSNIYFTATHTHTSIGAWHPSYVGEIFAGKFDERVPKHIAGCIAKAILQAEKNCSPGKIGYADFATQHLVFNRLVKEKGKVDSLLRIVKIEKDNGETAAIITFAAHCTVFHENLMGLSGDWAGLMMTQLKTRINFPCFSAGEVGSHGPYEVSKDQEAEAGYMAERVAKLVAENFDSIKTYDQRVLNMVHLPLYLRAPNDRVAQHMVIRPWLFRKLFGEEKVYINALQIGHILFEGTPCDFSGELIGPIDSVAKSKGLILVVTSFNGGYIGYVTDSKWYKMKAYETRTMGWFGPENGDYLSEVLERVISKTQSTKPN